MARNKNQLWQCPDCGEQFTTANQWHSCGSFSLDELFAKAKPETRALFDRFSEAVRSLGPVTIIPQKSRVAFQVRMRFAAITPRSRFLRGHLVLARRRPEPFFERITSYSPKSHVHEFRLDAEEQLSTEFMDCLKEAYSVGEQRHL